MQPFLSALFTSTRCLTRSSTHFTLPLEAAQCNAANNRGDFFGLYTRSSIYRIFHGLVNMNTNELKRGYIEFGVV